ncbi:MAG: gliding motility-associated peptidyl-prolyl isomerase GldI [Flavobacterium haoranii]|uniref:Peptidyl-prolyl cis-trans isomerase n=1 Tax=Flavobacterium haoranii TaxID=683124 RepID=A0A1M6K6S0_9FLAO|nr:gliding motility-associated peptidyl-prolyl isomerase GldI [Flavobacterium haoranii]MDK2772838.1 gliding motility-associated peptidyl-prolyl isomerase GldI [Flavobacterium sp.]SHJ54661.1 protein involved in gliding motility GldI [Flavobacterium haoranii]
MKKLLIALVAVSILTSCSKQQARKPVSYTSNNFMKESIARNKQLIANEEKLISDVIKKDSINSYIASNKGYWYKYITKVNDSTPFPKRGDIAFFDYEVKNMLNKIIYTKDENRPQQYYVDKQEMITGLQDGIKLMKKGETVTFLFPSHMAFGYHGDDKKIGSNQPLIYTVTLNDIKIDSTNTK